MNRKDKAKEIVSVFGKELGLKHVRVLINELEEFAKVGGVVVDEDNFYEDIFVETNVSKERISYLIDVEREINKLV